MSTPKRARNRHNCAGGRHPILKINRDGPTVIRGDTSPEFRLEPVAPAPPRRVWEQLSLWPYSWDNPPPLRPDLRRVARPKHYKRA